LILCAFCRSFDTLFWRRIKDNYVTILQQAPGASNFLEMPERLPATRGRRANSSR
jgi:hypothetical protein